MIYFNLDKTLKKPLYKQIVEQVHHKIKTHQVSHFDMLPSETQFQQIYHVSSFVVKKAYKILEDDHLIQRIKGKGTFIHTRKIHSVDTSNLDDIAIPYHHTYDYQILSVEFIKDQMDYYKQLKINKDNQIKVYRILVSHQKLPVCFFDLCIPSHIDINIYDWLKSNSRLKEIIKKLRHKEIIQMTTLNAASADKIISDILNISIYDPISVAKTTFYEDQMPISCILTYYPGDYNVFLRSNHEKITKSHHSNRS